jgi:hypothetical protein
MRNYQINKWILFPLVTLFFLLGVSCTRRDLDPLPDSNVKVVFDWKKLSAGESAPSKMKLLFYGSDGSVITRESNGGFFEGNLPAGTYSVLVFNEDYQKVTFSNMDGYSTAQAGLSTVPGTTGMLQPSFFYGTGTTSIAVSQFHETTVTLTPAALVKKVKVNFIVTGKTGYISSINGTLSGLSQLVQIAGGTLSNNSGTVSFKAEQQSGTGNYLSTITSWGCAPSSKNTLNMVLNFTDGGSQSSSVDISDALSGWSPAATVSIDIKLDISGDVRSGFTGIVKGWSYTTANTDVE